LLNYQQRLELLSRDSNQPLLRDIARGVEKESLRVNPTGGLALTPHPKALGSALTHPEITTDFSEALLEFITAPTTSVDHIIDVLSAQHRYTYRHIGDELLWVNSMPCQLGKDSEIPEAQYGSSNVAKMKTTYRVGLGHRYGRLMQTVAGIHYNFSIPDSVWEILRDAEEPNSTLQDFKTKRYFGLIRNFRRYFWLLLYLFGASPAVCRSFVKGRDHGLETINDDEHSYYAPNATSLRMGDLGYQSSAQESMIVCYNTIEAYIDTIRKALITPYDDYEAIGLKDDDGNYRQLNTNFLQIENEFYSTIRPKRTAYSGESPSHALWERGVEYIEVRCMDLNPLLPVGIDQEQMRFVDAFLVSCLLHDSPDANTAEYQQCIENQKRIVHSGRDTSQLIYHLGEEITIKEAATHILNSIADSCDLLDQAHNHTKHRDALATMHARIEDSNKTPAGQLIAAINNSGETYFRQAMNLAEKHRDHFLQTELAPELEEQFKALAEQSLEKQQAIEDADTMSFDEFLQDYYQRSEFSLY